MFEPYANIFSLIGSPKNRHRHKLNGCFTFRAKTDRVEQLSHKYPNRIAELEALFDKRTNLHIDLRFDGEVLVVLAGAIVKGMEENGFEQTPLFALSRCKLGFELV